MARTEHNAGDHLILVRDCELGRKNDTLVVFSVDGPHMTALVEQGTSFRFVRTGRDYEYAIQIGHLSWVPLIAEAVRRLHEESERAPDVRAVPMCLVRRTLFDELLKLVGRKEL